MEFRVLGPLQVLVGDRPIPLEDRRQRTLLAVFLLHADQVLSWEYLFDALWDVRPPATALRQLQNCVSALRRTLGPPHRDAPPVLVAEGRGYRLRLDDDTLDSRLFIRGVGRARSLAEAGDVSEAVTCLRAALSLWRGPALSGLDGRVLQAAAAGLEEQRLTAFEECVELELRLGHHHRLVGELTEAVATHPSRERLVGQLMRALHASGRRTDALGAFQRYRTYLAEEYGLDPGAPLRVLHNAVLTDDPSPAPQHPADPVDPVGADVRGEAPAGAPPTGPAPVPPPVVPAQLPADVAGFTGRTDHLKAVDDLVPPGEEGQGAVVVISAIVGMAGVGKTALAVHCGHRLRDRYPDGQLYLNLRGHSADEPMSHREALTHLLTSLGLPPERVPSEVHSATGLYRSLLAGRRVLVVLDNAGDADQVRPLLPGAAGCLALVTSRDRLSGLLVREGAHRIALDVLPVHEAVTLIARVLGHDRVAREPEAAARLVHACAYLPLALRVAAANLANHPHLLLSEYVEELLAGDRLSALEVDGDPHTGVRRAFDLTYRALDPDARRLFRLLSLVPGPDVNVEAAAELAALDTRTARRVLERLAAVHLISEERRGRYVVHDLLHEYATDLVGERDAAERDAALARLYRWYLRQVDGAADALYPHRLRLPMAPDVAGQGPALDQASALALLDTERANLVAAIRHAADRGPRPCAWALADALRGYFWIRMHTLDWHQSAGTALVAATEEGDLRAQAMTLISLGDVYCRQIRNEQAIDTYARALERAERVGWMEGQLAAVGNLAVVHRDSGQLREAAACHARALDLCRESGSRYGEAITLGCLGRTSWLLGRVDDAVAYCHQALALHRELGSDQGEAAVLGDLGEVYHSQGLMEEAMVHIERALALERRRGDRLAEAYNLRVAAAVHRDSGRLERAVELTDLVITLGRESGDRRVQADALNVVAEVHHRRGRHDEAIERYRQAESLIRDSGDRYPEIEALVGLAAEYACLHRVEEALRPFHPA